MTTIRRSAAHLYQVLLLALSLIPARGQAARAAVDLAQGEFGADLEFLQQHYNPPRAPGESNHFIDLWEGQTLRSLASACNLTNNHALFVNSHGGRIRTARGWQYAWYPHRTLLSTEKTSNFSAADLAHIVGPSSAPQIHNIILSGCNAEGAFKCNDLRKYFVNATNIVHMPAGQLGYQSMFLQVLTNPSAVIQPLYETRTRDSQGKATYYLGRTFSLKATRLSPYVAELFNPGQNRPFRTQIAGRELLASE